MKRFLTLIFAVTLLFSACVLGKGKINYYAKANLEFHLRQTPSKEGRRVVKINDDEEVAVLQVEGEWALCQKGNSKGYAHIEWLRRYRPLNAYTHPIPGTERMSGLAIMKLPAMLGLEGIIPSVILPGETIVLDSTENLSAVISFWRDKVTLQNGAFEYFAFKEPMDALPGEPISGFTTFWHKDTGNKLSENRVFNIQEAAKRINNVLIEPQGNFSFNTYCGPYQKSNGYLIGPIIGREKTGYAGGVCQLSTTLFLAITQLPVRIDEWALHSSYGVAYAPLWRDSTVGSYSDLLFTNLMPYAIRLEAKAQQNSITVIVYRADQ